RQPLQQILRNIVQSKRSTTIGRSNTSLTSVSCKRFISSCGNDVNTVAACFASSGSPWRQASINKSSVSLRNMCITARGHKSVRMVQLSPTCLMEPTPVAHAYRSQVYGARLVAQWTGGVRGTSDGMVNLILSQAYLTEFGARMPNKCHHILNMATKEG